MAEGSFSGEVLQRERGRVGVATKDREWQRTGSGAGERVGKKNKARVSQLGFIHIIETTPCE